jgi:4-alpha-glucanotransferase
LVKDSGFPNMKVIQFAFDAADTGGANDYLPHNYNTNCVVYTGTHDNETIAGWFAGLSKEQRDHIRNYLGDQTTPIKRMHRRFIDLAMMSTAKICIVPIQDWLALDNSARMNTPGTVDANWAWRLVPGQVTEELGKEMLEVSMRYGRANWDALNAMEEKTAE